MTVKLSLAAPPDLPRAVATPRYDRARLSPGVAHIGVGNFHRARQRCISTICSTRDATTTGR